MDQALVFFIIFGRFSNLLLLMFGIKNTLEKRKLIPKTSKIRAIFSLFLEEAINRSD